VNRTLIAGVGNIFLGDDGFGVEVAQRLAARALPPGVEVVDFGIRALDLGYALQDGYACTLLLDTVQRGGVPGTLYLIEPDKAAAPHGVQDAQPLAPHDLTPDSVLRFARAMGSAHQQILLLGCEPESFGTEDEADGRLGLSDPVAASVGVAVSFIESLLSRAQEQGRDLDEMANAAGHCLSAHR